VYAKKIADYGEKQSGIQEILIGNIYGIVISVKLYLMNLSLQEFLVC
jgi:hypothetical protein